MTFSSLPDCGERMSYWALASDMWAERIWPHMSLAKNPLWKPPLLPSLLFSHQNTEHPDGFLELRVVVQSLSHVRLFTTPWTLACQASLSFTMSRSLLKLMSTGLKCINPYTDLAFLLRWATKHTTCEGYSSLNPPTLIPTDAIFLGTYI